MRSGPGLEWSFINVSWCKKSWTHGRPSGRPSRTRDCASALNFSTSIVKRCWWSASVVNFRSTTRDNAFCQLPRSAASSPSICKTTGGGASRNLDVDAILCTLFCFVAEGRHHQSGVCAGAFVSSDCPHLHPPQLRPSQIWHPRSLIARRLWQPT